jgi:tight adherence protein C
MMNSLPQLQFETAPTLLLAETDPAALLPSLVIGAAVTVFFVWLIRALVVDDLEQEDEWRYDISRINELRRQDVMYRLLQPLFGLLARINRNVYKRRLPEVERQLQVAGLSRFWLPEEYLGKLQLIAALMFPVYAFVFFRVIGFAGFVTALVATALTAWFLRIRLRRQADKRLAEIKRRLPFLLDLLTLLMEAGSSFLQALRQGVIEFKGHPVSSEFGRVLTDMNMGKARTEAFDGLRRRLDDDEISAIVGAIIQSEELGTPVSEIFRTQSDVLRVKRSQRAEKIANEAGVNMLLPAMLVMASTVILILGPFVLNYMIYGMGL